MSLASKQLLWWFSLNARDGKYVGPDNLTRKGIEGTSGQISDAIRFGRASAIFSAHGHADRQYSLQVATIGGALLAKLYTTDKTPVHAMTIGAAPSHARSARLLWESLVENPRADNQPKRPIGSWCAYRIETVHEKPEILDWLKAYSQGLAFAWLSMVPRPK